MNHIHNSSCCHDSGNHNSEHACGGCGCGQHQAEINLSEEENEFLKQLAQTPFLPLARFVLKSTKSDHLESVALAPVYINSKTDSMETVKQIAAVLIKLKEKGFITLDYDVPLENGDYDDYSDSKLYTYFKETVEQAKVKKDFIFDIPSLELGSIALTYLGQIAIEQMDKLK